jgi:hypothetical protein
VETDNASRRPGRRGRGRHRGPGRGQDRAPAGQSGPAGRQTLCSLALHTGKGSRTLTAKQLKAGRYALTATYAGNATYLTSVSPAVTVKVTG